MSRQQKKSHTHCLKVPIWILYDSAALKIHSIFDEIMLMLLLLKSSGKDENTVVSEVDEFGSETSIQSENDNDDRSEEDFPIHSSFPADLTSKTHIQEEDRKRKNTIKDQDTEISGLDENKIGFTFDDSDTSDEEVSSNFLLKAMTKLSYSYSDGIHSKYLIKLNVMSSGA